MTLSIRAFPGGPAMTNAYLVADPETKTALIVDAPLDVTDEILAAAREEGLTVERIVITHTHWDHIGEAAELQTKSGAPMAAHPLAVERLANPGSALMDLPIDIPPSTPDELLDDGDTVRLGEHQFQVMYLPGHDDAHIVLVSEPDRVFLGGDVLFPNGHGRTDLPGANQATMNKSLARLVDLPPDTVVYPGHGDPTTIGQEAWLQDLRGA
jgi:hydroxyacylglutathione hydrolase